MALIYALTAVLGWGTWMGLSQNVRYAHPAVRTVWMGAVNTVFALAVALVCGFSLVPDPRWIPAFAGGLVWSLSGVMAFTGTNHIGLTRANGIWAPLNIITGLVCGMVFFGEFRNADWTKLLFLAGCLVWLLAGILLMIVAKPEAKAEHRHRRPGLGYFGAIAAGFLWGIYFIPVNASGLPPLQAQVPLAAGITAGALVIVLIVRRPRLLLDKPSDWVRTSASALLWGTGNYGMFLLTTVVGSGLGFAIAQSSLVVSALWGIFLLKEPPLKSRSAVLSLVGIALAASGAMVLSTIRS